ncbi:MAG TPA: hypothetical protein VFV10_13705 [Gammaproteobacteria bacterium]|nr:hypothetical protein [Gammaproteobacteria bacterium]
MSAQAVSRDGDGDRRIKKSALTLALVAAAVYLGFIVWGLLHGLS